MGMYTFIRNLIHLQQTQNEEAVKNAQRNTIKSKENGFILTDCDAILQQL